MGVERRRAERHEVAGEGLLLLGGGRSIPVRIRNLGVLGALVSVVDLEEAVLEGERAALEHPLLDEDGRPTEECRRTPGAVVRVELEFGPEGIHRLLAVFFDGGGYPAGIEPA